MVTAARPCSSTMAKASSRIRSLLSRGVRGRAMGQFLSCAAECAWPRCGTRGCITIQCVVCYRTLFGLSLPLEARAMAGAKVSTPLGLFGTESLLGEEEVAIRDSVRQFVTERIKPNIGQWFEDGQMPVRDLALELGELGALGMHLEGYGTAGMSATSYGLTCMDLEAGDSGLRSLVSVQGSLAMFAIWKHGSEEQKQEWLPKMAAGEAIGCFGLTEPEAGSDPAAMRTRAVRDGDDWVLNGTKMWITNGSVSDVAIVWAQTEDGVRGFVVPAGTPGFSAPEIGKKMSLRASVTSELVLDDVRLPADAMLPEAKGLSGPLSCLNEARFGIVFGSLGAARDSLETAIDYAQEREIFAKPLSSFQQIGRASCREGGEMSGVSGAIKIQSVVERSSEQRP